MDPMLRAGTQTASMDPMVIIPAMAAVTKTVGFGVTGSTSYINPYILARTMSTLDHFTEGRVAWNVVTSWSKNAAQALGADDVVSMMSDCVFPRVTDIETDSSRRKICHG